MDCISVVFRLLVLHTYFRSYSTYILMQLFKDVQIIANCTGRQNRQRWSPMPVLTGLDVA